MRANLFKKLDVFLRLDSVVVDECPVGTAQVHHIQLDSATLGAVRSGVWHQSVLQYCMLFAAGQVVQGHVSHLAVSAQQVSRLTMDVEDGKFLTALEHIQSPFLLRFPCLWRLCILDKCSIDCVGVGCQSS